MSNIPPIQGHNNPYAPPTQIQGSSLPPGKPGVILWYKIFCVFSGLVYFGVVTLGFFMYFSAADLATQPGEEEIFKIEGIVFGVMGFVLAAMFLAGALYDKGNGAWIYGIVLIAIALTSCYCWPISIPLLIFWIKPETKEYLRSSK